MWSRRLQLKSCKAANADREDPPAFAFDLMELERLEVDRALLSFLKSEVLQFCGFRDQR
jgi:hypothetical protein